MKLLGTSLTVFSHELKKLNKETKRSLSTANGLNHTSGDNKGLDRQLNRIIKKNKK